MSADKTKDVPVTLAMAQILLQQGDVWRAEKMFQQLLEHEPGNLQARSGLERCRVLRGRGDESMQEKKLAILKLLLARLTGQPAPVAEEAAAPEPPAAPEPAVSTAGAAPPDPRQRRLRILQTLLEKVQAWKLQAAR